MTKVKAVKFQYREFYDVPRYLTLRYRGRLLLLQSAFDEELDEYLDTYSVYDLPDSAERLLTQPSWEFLENTPLKFIGRIQVKAVEFDSTKRKTLDGAILDTFLSN